MAIISGLHVYEGVLDRQWYTIVGRTKPQSQSLQDCISESRNANMVHVIYMSAMKLINA